jgi:uncharacterized short protein YbdD (DUF466 family)
MSDGWRSVQSAARKFLLRLREWCGDAAYERYRRTIARKNGACLLTAEQFYVEQLERKYSRPSRCC